MEKYKPILKHSKKLEIANLLALPLVTAMILTATFTGKFQIDCQHTETTTETEYNNEVDTELKDVEQVKYRNLDELRKVELETYITKFDGVQHKFAYEQDILNLSKEFSLAIKHYFKECGATNWTNEELQQFWPEDIEYMVTAIAYRESSYRTDVTNDLNCSGLTCLNKSDLLKTLREEWLVSRIWGDTIPKVNCVDNEVDIFNGTINIEYTFYNIGYNLANRFKKDKYFTDIDGQRRSIWQVLEYSTETQNRLIIASHLFGMPNVVNAVFGRPNDKGVIVPIEDYVYSNYVEDVLNKMHELKRTYEQELGY